MCFLRTSSRHQGSPDSVLWGGSVVCRFSADFVLQIVPSPLQKPLIYLLGSQLRPSMELAQIEDRHPDGVVTRAACRLSGGLCCVCAADVTEAR